MNDRHFKILITDANSKHSIALQRYLRRAMPDVCLIGHAPGRVPYCRFQKGAHKVLGGTLEDALDLCQADMVIPVGGRSVRLVARVCQDKAVLPSADSLERCFDKVKTFQLAAKIGIPHPATIHVTSIDEVDQLPLNFPCVIKPANETEAKGVRYAANAQERHDAAAFLFTILPPDATYGLLVQEQVAGVGRGFFAVYDHGRPITIFMHERLREYGGASTAARAIYDPRLRDYGVRLLNELDWHGPAMVEFKYDPVADCYNLIEINPKFWGSLELGLSAGVNFGHVLVRIYRGEEITYSESYDRNKKFYWPLDGDLELLIQTRQLGRVRDYIGMGGTNLFQSFLADGLKSSLFLRSLLLNQFK